MRCANHPNVEATLECTACSACWCDACPRKVGLSHHVVCATCGHALAKYVVSHPADEVLARSFRRAISTEGLVTGAALAVFYGVLSSLAAVPVIYLASLVSYYFVTVHHVGDGKPGLPGPAETVDNWTEMRTTALGGIFTAGLGFLPLIVAITTTRTPLDDRMFVALALLGQLYMPAIILSVAVTNSPWAAIWPPTWVRVIGRAPGQYVRFVGLWIVSVLLGLVVLWATTQSLTGSVPGDCVAAFAWNLFWFFQASLVGEYVRRNASAYGWD
ncbi:MAG: hypothetical protein SFX73_37765 [Kofleriaceae bacterium]|nr:hypothetical protein [Kofleriaceae bacterium]